MRPTRTVAYAIAAVMAAAGLSACGSSSGGSSTAAAPASTVLNVGMPNGPQTNNSNPFLGSSAGASLGYRYMIYEPLVMMNTVQPAAAGTPWLATKWAWASNYTSLTLTIRNNVTWSDGTPMTAADVAYTFQLLKTTPALNTNAIPFGAVTTSGSTVTVTFPSSQYVNQTKILSTFIVPQHIWSKMADPATDTDQNPVGTGPYTLKSFTSQTITLQERSSYWQALPKVKELRYTSYNDNDSQTTALANDSAEWSFVFIPNAQAVYVSKDPAHNQLWFPPTLGVHGLWINTQDKPFNNPVLRQAMSMVVNRTDILNQGEGGYFYPEVSSVTGIPTPAGNSFISSQYSTSVYTAGAAAAAKSLLTGAGFTYKGAALYDTTGKAVSITLSDPAGWSDYITDLEIIKDNLATIGINATVDKADENAWTTAVDTGNFQAVMHWTNNGATPYDMYESIMDGAIYKPVGTGGVSGNYGRFQDPAATAALKQYADATDAATRTAALDTLEQIEVTQVPVIITSAANAGAEFSTKHWVGWPTASNPYAAPQPTIQDALEVVLHLKPAS
jgi:peptide/nickel transport system substrate-binding protein